MDKTVEQINFDLIELCKYQQSIISQYKEYIEKNIIGKISEEDFEEPDFNNLMKITSFKRVTIPQTTFMLRCDPSLLREWNLLKHETPLISPEYFIMLSYEARKLKKEFLKN